MALRTAVTEIGFEFIQPTLRVGTVFPAMSLYHLVGGLSDSHNGCRWQLHILNSVLFITEKDFSVA